MRAFLNDTKDGRIHAGEIGLRYLFNTLGDAKRPDIVLQMARQEEHPSYMRFLRRGETTLSEFWQDACRSKCHDMLGTIYEWFYASVLGLKPLGNAWRTFVIEPAYDSEFDHIEGEVDSPYGLINVKLTRKVEESDDSKGTTALRVTVPFGTTATINLPSFNVDDTADCLIFVGDEKDGKKFTEKTIELSHGTYTVLIPSTCR